MNTITITKQREKWIDYSKVVLIYLMVVCHIGTTTMADTIICSFHMSAFFIISGCLHKNTDFGVGMRKSLQRLIVPVLFFNALGYMIWLVTSAVGDFTIKEYVTKPLLGLLFLNPKFAHPMCMPMWFCVTLFFIKSIVSIRSSKKYHFGLLFTALTGSLVLISVDCGGGEFH